MNDQPPQSPEGHPEHREREPKFPDLTVITTTMYGHDEVSRVRQRLAERFLDRLDDLQLRAVVVDGGSDASFAEAAERHANVAFLPHPELKMGESRRFALRQAMEQCQTPYYLWVEPEKISLLTEANLTTMIDGLRRQSTDIVVPSRRETDTMGRFQAWIEQRANRRANALAPEPSQEELDLWFGPKMFDRDGAEYFLQYHGGLDRWDSIMKPVLNARRAGKRVTSVPVDFSYDPTEQDIEDRDPGLKRKRFDQYRTILAELGDEFWQGKNR